MTKTVSTSGKRKTAIARATLTQGKGRVFINRVPLENIEPEFARLKMSEPLAFIDETTRKSVDIAIKVTGGGFMGQADATRIAIARGLLSWTESADLKEILAQYDRHAIAGDARRKAPKTYGGPGARARFQKSYR
jgi:small subunit ribosomal protein S9